MAESTTVARPYARAVFEVARAAGTLSQWSAALAGLAAIVQDESATRYLRNPKISDHDRLGFLTSVAARAIGDARVLESDAGQNFLRLVIENDRLPALPDIAARFDDLKAEAERTVEVTLMAASDVDAGLAARIAQRLESKLGRAVELKVTVDPNLIGGAVIRAGDQVIDGSVRSRLQSLTQALVS